MPLAVKPILCIFSGMPVDDIYFRLRLSDELREEVREIATRNRRSMTAQIVIMIEEWLADYRENEEMAEHAADISAAASPELQEHRRVMREQTKSRPRNEALFTRAPATGEWDALANIEKQIALITAALIAKDILPNPNAKPATGKKK